MATRSLSGAGIYDDAKLPAGAHRAKRDLRQLMTSARGAPVAGSAAEQGHVLYAAVNAMDAQQPARNALG